MRLIPVLDLLDGVVVHAVRGEREHYLPVKSVLCETAEPMVVARSFRDRLGLTEIYIADLNAIQGRPHPEHREAISTLARQEGLTILVDAGAADVETAQELLDLGAHQVVIGAETLPYWDMLRVFPATIPGDKLVFSLDMRAGTILSRCPEMASLSPIEALLALQTAGWKEIILLDLNRVGSGSGVDRALIIEARAKLPELSLIAGGGIAEVDDLRELDKLGVAGVLAATALHRGTITVQHIAQLGLG
jgi:phosphoribosylformimino-5-aminoimidazole carboxamide ribotide isomerase